MNDIEFHCGDRVRVKEDDFFKNPHVGDIGVITSIVCCHGEWSVFVMFETDPYEVNISPHFLELVKSKEEMTCKSYMKQGVIKTDKMQVGEEYNQPKDDKNLIRKL